MAAVIIVCVIIKWWFAEADAQRLGWLLKLTGFLAGYFSGLSFVAWPGEGYYNAAEGLFLVAACSGFNFFIILLATGGSPIVWHWPDFFKRLSGLTAWALLAYVVTLAVNTLRVLLALLIYRADLSLGPLSPERLHRLEGVGVYYVCLCLAGYLFFTLILPLLKGALKRSGGLMIEHGLTIILVCSFFTVSLYFLIRPEKRAGLPSGES